MTQLVPSAQALGFNGLPVQASSDDQLIDLWLYGKSAHTCRAYEADLRRFRAFTGRTLAQVTLGDLQGFAESLTGSDATRRRTVASVKSVLTFGQKLGYLPFNVGAALHVKAQRDTLAERILSEADVQRMLALETNPRNHALLRFMYATGVRNSEVAGLRWRNLQPTDHECGVANIHGKGNKTRTIRVEAGPWQEVWALRGEGSTADSPVFLSRRGGALNESQVFRIVRAAAARAGIEATVSPHWMRHAHASHALDRGAPVSLVQATLGHSSIATTGRYLHARPGESSGRYLSA